MDRDRIKIVCLSTAAAVILVTIGLTACLTPTPTIVPPTDTPTPAIPTDTPTPFTSPLTPTATVVSPIRTPTLEWYMIPEMQDVTPTLPPLETPPAQGGEIEKLQEPQEEKQMSGIGVDYSQATIAGVSLVALALLVVEGAKQFGVTGKASLALAMGFGAVVTGLYAAIERGLVPTGALPWVETAVYALGGMLVIGLGSSGLYELLKRSGLVK